MELRRRCADVLRYQPRSALFFNLDTEINHWKSGSLLLTGRRSARPMS